MNPGRQVTCIIVLYVVVPGGEPDLNNRPEFEIFAPGSPQLIAFTNYSKNSLGIYIVFGLTDFLLLLYFYFFSKQENLPVIV